MMWKYCNVRCFVKIQTFAFSPLIVSISVSSPNLNELEAVLLGRLRVIVMTSPLFDISVTTLAFRPASMYSAGTPGKSRKISLSKKLQACTYCSYFIFILILGSNFEYRVMVSLLQTLSNLNLNHQKKQKPYEDKCCISRCLDLNQFF